MNEELVKKLIEARGFLLRVMNKLPDEGVLVDKWGKKEILAHIAGWGEEGITAIPQILHGEKPRSLKISMNRFNEENVNKRKKMTVRELLNEMSKHEDELIKVIQQLTKVQISGYFGTKLGKKDINVLWIINETIEHDNNHAKELEEKFK